jgi:hypothetical protein
MCGDVGVFTTWAPFVFGYHDAMFELISRSNIGIVPNTQGRSQGYQKCRVLRLIVCALFRTRQFHETDTYDHTLRDTGERTYAPDKSPNTSHTFSI